VSALRPAGSLVGHGFWIFQNLLECKPAVMKLVFARRVRVFTLISCD